MPGRERRSWGRSMSRSSSDGYFVSRSRSDSRRRTHQRNRRSSESHRRHSGRSESHRRHSGRSESESHRRHRSRSERRHGNRHGNNNRPRKRRRLNVDGHDDRYDDCQDDTGRCSDNCYCYRGRHREQRRGGRVSENSSSFSEECSTFSEGCKEEGWVTEASSVRRSLSQGGLSEGYLSEICFSEMSFRNGDDDLARSRTMTKISEQMRSHGLGMLANAAKIEERSKLFEETKRRLLVLRKDNKALRKCIEVVCKERPGVCSRKDSPLVLLDAVHTVLWKKKRRAKETCALQKSLLKAALAERNKESAKREEAEDSLLCVVCCENHRNKVLLPCKHLVLCDTCHPDGECPICRTPIAESLQIFLS